METDGSETRTNTLRFWDYNLPNRCVRKLFASLFFLWDHVKRFEIILVWQHVWKLWQLISIVLKCQHGLVVLKYV